MEVYHARLLLLLLPFILIAVGCAPRWDADTKAQRFFDKGRAQILTALEDRKATVEQLERARAVLGRHEREVVSDIAGLFRRQQEMILAVTSGKKTATLLELDEKLHAAHLEAVRAIGRMHEELEDAVGAPSGPR
jgi:hypothetical protein